MAYKYPFISDKKMYAAVMFACKIIRETGFFNRAVEKAADYYNVSEEELKQHIRERQSAGQKGKVKGRKYRWFIVQKCGMNDAQGVFDFDEYKIVRAVNALKAEFHFSDIDMRNTKDNDYGGAYSTEFFHTVIADKNGYDTKKEAQEALQNLKNEE